MSVSILIEACKLFKCKLVFYIFLKLWIKLKNVIKDVVDTDGNGGHIKH